MGKNARRATRRLLMQAFYQKQLTGHDLPELRGQFSASDEFAKVDSEYFALLFAEVDAAVQDLDVMIGRYGDIPADQLDPVERAILWVAIGELQFHPEVPKKVVINEAIELAKMFGAEGGHRYVNALLDKVAAGPKSRFSRRS